MSSSLTRTAKEKETIKSAVILMLGIGVVRAWYVYNLYDLYATVTFGLGPVVINTARILTIFALVAIVLIFNSSVRRMEFTLTWISLMLMTGSSLMQAYEIYFDVKTFWLLRCMLAGIGLAWGGGIWVKVYERLKPVLAFLCVSGGLIFSCVLILVLGTVSSKVAVAISIFLPTIASLLYMYADQGLKKPFDVRRDGGLKIGGLRYALSINKKFLSALCVFAFVLGVSRGVPYEYISAPHYPEWVASQLTVIFLCFIAIWTVARKKSGFIVPAYWAIENFFVVIAVCLLMSTWTGAPRLTSAFIGIATSCFYPFVFYYSYTVGRWYGGFAYIVVGIIYGLVLTCMNIGRVNGILLMGEITAEGYVLILAVLVIAEVLLAMLPGSLVEWPLNGPRRANEPVCQAVSERTQFTKLEMQIIELLAQGRSRSVIADSLGYSENTIRNYIRKIYKKVDVHSKQELLDKIYNIEDKISI